MRYLLEIFERGYFVPDAKRGGDEEVDIVRAAIRKANRQTSVLLVAACFTLLTRIISTVLSNTFKSEREFPFNIALPRNVDMRKSPYFELLFVFQSIGVFFLVIFIIFYDILINAFIIHADAQFKLLYNSLLKLDRRAALLTEEVSLCINSTQSRRNNEW